MKKNLEIYPTKAFELTFKKNNFIHLLMERNKRGVSPIIATVLLIGIVVAIGVIVFMWFRGISEEAITKFDGTNVKLVCEDVNFRAEYANGFVTVSNEGNVPIYKIKARVAGGGSEDTFFLTEDWPETGLLEMGVYYGDVSSYTGDKMYLIPVLAGENENGEKSYYVCDDRNSIVVNM